MTKKNTPKSATTSEKASIELHLDFFKQLLVPLGTFISQLQDLDAVFKELVPILHMRHISLYRVDAQGTISTVCSIGKKETSAKNTEILKNMNLYIAWKKNTISSIPMPSEGDNIVMPVGVDNLFLAAGDSSESRDIARVETTLFQLVGSVIANMLRSMMLIEQANTDKLTTLLNRGALDKYIYEGKDPFGKPLDMPKALCMLDIDHFKRFNDTFGHHVGDQVLKHVADTVRTQAGDGNFTYRFGGEEITVVIHDTTARSSEQIAEDIRRTIETTPLMYEGISYPVTISVGVYEFEETLLEKKDAKFFALKYADTALYRAKEGGRNKVCLYAERRRGT